MSDCREFKSLADDHQEQVRRRLFNRQDETCFLCEKPIDLQADEVEVDHINPRAAEGLDDDSNWALMHAHCNRSKGAKDLDLARVMARFRNLSEEHEGELYARQVLESVGGSSNSLFVDIQDEVARIRWDIGGGPVEERHPVVLDPGGAPFPSFFALLPVEVLYHDEDLNPRKIIDIDKLLAEFYRKNPQLHVALARIHRDNSGHVKVLVFYGQHKMAAQIMLGRRKIPVRVFIDPDSDRLKAVNRRAHKELRQVEFFKAVLDNLGDDIWGKGFKAYIENQQHSDKSEKGFIQSLPADQRSEMKRNLKEHLRAQVVNFEEPPNRFFAFVEKDTSQATDKPIAYNSVQQAIFKLYLDYSPNREAIALEDEEERDDRQIERSNLTHFMNILAAELLHDRYDEDIGVHRLEHRLREGEHIPDNHLRAVRMFRKSPFQTWAESLYEAIAFFLRARGLINADMEQHNQIFWAELGEDEWETIRAMVQRVREHQVWLGRDEQRSRWFGQTKLSFFQEWFRDGIVEGQELDTIPLNAAYLQQAVGAT